MSAEADRILSQPALEDPTFVVDQIKEWSEYISAAQGVLQAADLLDAGPTSLAAVRELRTEGPAGKKTGDAIDVSAFVQGDVVKVSGLSKAKGFQGVVKRHRFAGGPASHGQKHSLREPGSIGATWPQRVLKGTRMAGRMGGDRRTVRNLTVMQVDKDAHVIALLGAIPGRRGGLVEIRG